MLQQIAIKLLTNIFATQYTIQIVAKKKISHSKNSLK